MVLCSETASASLQQDRWFVLRLNHQPQVWEYPHNPRLTELSLTLQKLLREVSASMYFRFIQQVFLFLLSDNIFSIKSWAKKKFAFDDSRINKAFGIPEDFDYMDWLPPFFFFFWKSPHSWQGKNVCTSFSFRTTYLASADLVHVSWS